MKTFREHLNENRLAIDDFANRVTCETKYDYTDVVEWAQDYMENLNSFEENKIAFIHYKEDECDNDAYTAKFKTTP